MSNKITFTTRQYLKALFDDYEWVNLCYGNPRETKEVKSYELRFNRPLSLNAMYICCNPLKPGTTRATKNISAFRNILVEFDTFNSVEAQLEYIKGIGLPYTTLVHSGNKSVHAVISLTSGLTKEEYRILCSKMKHVIKKADKACFEAARLTRLGNNRVGQDILDIKERVSIVELNAWLTKHGVNHLDFETELVDTKTDFLVNPRLTKQSQKFLACQIPPEDAHRASLQTIKNLHEIGYTYDEIVDTLTRVRLTNRPQDGRQEARRKVARVVKWVYREWIEKEWE